jgi:hypothetical protein
MGFGLPNKVVLAVPFDQKDYAALAAARSSAT